MILYYDPEGIYNDPAYTITTQTIAANQFGITLIQEGIGDDSVYGEKVIMYVHRNGTTWTVSEIRKSWKCQEDRGHVSWSADACD